MAKRFAERARLDLSEVNKEVLKDWNAEDVFHKSETEREGCPSFIFFEGPPSANGHPGIHHVMARTLKDTINRYKTMQGFQVKRKAGWERFEDIRESAQKWIPFVKEQENPDFIIGLLHSGMDEGIVTPEYHENAVRETVSSVDGFDLVLYGHDHHSNMEEIESPSGKSVMCVNAGSYAYSVAEIKLKFSLDDDGKVVKHDIDPSIKYIGTINNLHAAEFKRHFKKDFKEVKDYASRLVGRFTAGVNISDAYFGPSAYIDFIQYLLLQASGADISLMAPLFFNASIDAGEIHVSDLFNLYRFEDCIYTLCLTGKEIKNYLEMSYANWTNQMHSIDDNLLLLSPMKSNPERMGFTNFIFNFDSAAGIIYEVDVTRPQGEKITIKRMHPPCFPLG